MDDSVGIRLKEVVDECSLIVSKSNINPGIKSMRRIICIPSQFFRGSFDFRKERKTTKL
jgi:hypothetical protein